MQELAPALSKFGPGVAYGTDTIQSLIDDLVVVNYPALLKAFPTIVNPSTDSRHYSNDEYLELDQFRDFIIKNIQYFLEEEKHIYPKIIEEEIPVIEESINIIYNIFIPVIEKVTSAKPEPVKRVITQISSMLNKTNIEENWDLPKITNRILMWMSSILEKSDCDFDVVSDIFSLWTQFIESTHRTEYMLRLALSWYKISTNPPEIDTTNLLTQIKSNIKLTTFADFLTTESKIMYLHEIHQNGNDPPSSIKDLRQRRIAASKGFLYVAEPTTGLTKFGTGCCGTVFASNERSSSICTNCDAHSLCVCDDHLLLSFQGLAPGIVEVMSIESLERIGSLESSKPIPPGPFTAAGDRFYVISKSVLYVYKKSGMKVKLLFTRGLVRPEREFFPVPLPRDYEKFVSLVTDGVVIGIIFPPHLFSNSEPVYHQYLIETGELMHSSSNLEEGIHSMYVAVDLEANTIIEAPYWEPVRVISLSPVYKVSRLYLSTDLLNLISQPTDPEAISISASSSFSASNLNLLTKSTFDDEDPIEIDEKNVPLVLLRALLPLLASRVSVDEFDPNQQFALKDTQLVKELIEKMKEDERYLVFSDVAVSLLALYDMQVPSDSYTAEYIFEVLALNGVHSNSKINFMRSIIQNPLLSKMKTSECRKIISTLKEREIISIFEDGFYDKFGFLLAILEEERVINYTKKRVSNLYQFVNSMTLALMRGVFVHESISCSAAVPLLKCIKKASPYVIPTLLAPIMPLIPKMLEEDAIVAVSFQNLSAILQSMESLCSANHLTKYAKKHFETRVGNNFIETNVVEESPHPYENNSHTIKNYDFPGAVRIIITFDPETSTEEGCDFLQIFQDTDCTEPLTREMSGPFALWESPIIANCQHLTFKFESDASINGYGYKAQIQVTSLATTLAYKSPQIFYDLSRALFLALLKVAERYYAPPEGFWQSKFTFPHNLEAIDFNKEMCISLIKKICDKFDTEDWSEDLGNLFDPSSAFPNAYSYLNYVFENCDENDGDMWELVQRSAMHPMVAESPFVDNNDMFSQIGAILMQNTLGLPDDMYHFLFSALKDSNAGHAFAERSFKAAGELCSAANPSFEVVLQAATKIQIGLSIIGPSIINEQAGVIPKFLDAYRRVVIPVSAPSILRLNEKIRSIFSEIACTVQIDSPFFTWVSENLAKVEQTPPHSTSPFVLFALSIAGALEPEKANREFVLSVILLSLTFNTTQTIILLQGILSRFHFETSIEEKPEIVHILELIGNCFSFNVTESTEHELFDIGPSFSMARAEIVRRILHPDKFDQLAPVIAKGGDAALGALLVLSVRNFPPHIHQEVKLKSTGEIVTISSMDYVEYRFMNQDGLSFSIPALDVSSFEYVEVPFKQIHPPRLNKVSQSLIDAVISMIGVYDPHALSALSELSYSTPLPLEISRKFPFKNYEAPPIPTGKIDLVLKEFRERSTWVATFPTPAFSVIAKPSMTIGYFSGTGEATLQSFSIKINHEKMIVFPQSLNLPLMKLDGERVTIGFFGSYKQVFVQTGKTLTLPPVFLSVFEDPTPFIVSDSKPEGFEESQSAPSFFMNKLLPINNAFTHAATNNNLMSLLKDTMEFNGVSTNEVHLLPPLPKEGIFPYFEFNVTAEYIDVNIHPETLKALNLYSFNVSEPSQYSTYGLMVDTINKIAFMTKDGSVINESQRRIRLTKEFTVTLNLKEAETIRVNTGFSPFMFSVNNYIQSFPKSFQSIQNYTPKLVPNAIPHSFQPVYDSDYPFDLYSVCGETQIKADVPLERPCILTAADIDQKLYQRTAVFTQIDGTEMVSAKLYNVRNQTWMSLDLPKTSVYSIADSNTPENVFAAHERMQRSLKPFLSPYLYSVPTEGSKKNYTIFTTTCQQKFKSECTNKYSCKIAVNSVINNMSLLNDNELDEFVTKATTVLGADDFSGHCSESLTKLFKQVVQNRPKVFEKIVKKSVAALLYPHQKEPIIVSNKSSNVFTEVERRNADAIYVRLTNSAFALPLSLNSISMRNSCIVEKETDITQCTMPGDMITIGLLDKDQLCFLEVIPLSLETCDEHNCFRLALHLISFVVENSEGLTDLLHNEIIMPLFKNIMSGGTVLFGMVIAEWLLCVIHHSLLSEKQMKEYSRLINLNVLLSTKDPQLAVAITIFSMHAYAQYGDSDEVREKLVGLMEPFLEGQNHSSPVSLVFHRIASDLISPLRKEHTSFVFLEKIKSPLITTFALKALANSKQYIEKIEIKHESETEAIQEVEIDASAASRAFFELKGNHGSMVTVNDIALSESTIIEVPSSKKFVVAIPRSDPKGKSIVVTVLLEAKMPNPASGDIITTYTLYRELQSCWTVRDESMATAVARSIEKDGSLFRFDDSFFEQQFPNVSAAASRFRVSSLMLLARSQGQFILKPTISMRPFLPDLTPSIPQVMHAVKQGVSGYTPISTVSLSNFYGRAAIQFSANACFPGDRLVQTIFVLNIKDPTTLLKIVRSAKNDLFESPVWRDDAALLPKAALLSVDDLTAFMGFGYHMAMNLVHGRSLPLPVSRVVLRFAFGGTVVADDFEDVDPDFAASGPSTEEVDERVLPMVPQLRAVRRGVSMALNGQQMFDADSIVFPRLAQLQPLKPPHSIEGLPPLFVAPLREQMFEQKASLLKPEDRIELISDIVSEICNMP